MPARLPAAARAVAALALGVLLSAGALPAQGREAGRGAATVTAPLPPSRPGGQPGAPAIPAAPPTQPRRAPTLPQASFAPSEQSEASACLRGLNASAGNLVRRAAPAAPASEGCQVDDPVMVEALAARLADGAGQVRLQPPPTISCELARTLSQWLDSSLQPLARGAFGRELTALQVGGGHECRRRNRQAQTPLSEHASGRALDIFAFHLGEERRGGIVVSVEKPGGLVQARFLEAVRHSACGAFMTALGPGSDAAHANHLHVDIQQRRAASSRFCQ